MLGVPLYRPPLLPHELAAVQAGIDSAAAAFRAHPGDPATLLALGHRLAAARRHREAIATFTRGTRLYPSDPRFYRQRGEHYLACRQFDLAVADLETAADLAAAHPDQPEESEAARPGLPRGTLHASIQLRLGLAHYFRRDFQRALPYLQAATSAAGPADFRRTAAEWLYMSYRRLGRQTDAAALLQTLADSSAGVLRRLPLYRGELTPETLLAGESPRQLPAEEWYPVANWYLYNGRREEALSLFRRILDTPEWDLPGYIAAEVELGDGR